MANQYSGFVPTTQIWDVEDIKQMNVNSDEFKELLVRMHQNLNQMALGVNSRDIAVYNTQETVCGQTFFPGSANKENRSVYRKTINFGALPNATTKTVAHGIIFNSGCSITRFYGGASNTTSLLYIPLSNPGITLSANSTNISITTTSDMSGYNLTYVVIEYLKI